MGARRAVAAAVLLAVVQLGRHAVRLDLLQLANLVVHLSQMLQDLVHGLELVREVIHQTAHVLTTNELTFSVRLVATVREPHQREPHEVSSQTHITVLVKHAPFTRENRLDVATFPVQFCSFTCSLGPCLTRTVIHTPQTHPHTHTSASSAASSASGTFIFCSTDSLPLQCGQQRISGGGVPMRCEMI